MKIEPVGNRSILAAILLLFIISQAAPAQQRDSTAFFQVETVDGNEYIGKIIDEDAEKIRLKTDKLGELVLLKTDILKISPVNITNIKKGIYFLVLLSMGGRRIIKKAGLDFGLFLPMGKDIGTFIAIPWLGLTIPFGNIRKK